MTQKKKLDNLITKIRGHHYVAASLILVIVFLIVWKKQLKAILIIGCDKQAKLGKPDINSLAVKSNFVKFIYAFA